VRLQNWLNRHLRNRLALLYDLEQAALAGAARGLAFQLAEAMGALPRGRVAAQAAVLERADRKALQGLGVRLGAASVYLPGVQTPPQQRFKALLWSIYREREVFPPPSERVALPAPADWDEATALALGFRLCGRPDRPRLAVRLEALEKLAVAAHRAAPVAADGGLAKACGLEVEQLPAALGALGFRPLPGSGPAPTLWAPKPKRDKRARPRPRQPEAASPFAALAELKGRGRR
jgi:ATP-dependent RNA helicase SUPV3L1/SUV3